MPLVGEQTDLPAAGLFYGIGHKPNSDLIAGRVELDEKGYVKVWRVLGGWMAWWADKVARV